MKREFSQQIFEKYSNIKSHENPPSSAQFHADGQTDGWTDMTKLTVAFRYFVNAPKNWRYMVYTNLDSDNDDGLVKLNRMRRKCTLCQ